jgi:RNA polymerase sigma-70 factor, ECF subfamily
MEMSGADHDGVDPGYAADAARDARLVRRVCRGDMEAYGELVRHHTRRAYSVAWGILQHRQDAEDAVQDAFARVLERIDTFDASRSFRPWLQRIVMNTAISVRRARSVRRTQPLVEHARSAEPGPDAAAEHGELRTRLLRALDTLPDRQRTLVLLADVEELSSTEIGEIMDMPAGTVRYQLHLARRALRGLLSSDEEAR